MSVTPRSDGHDPIAENEQLRHIGQRTMYFSVFCLVVVILVMVISLVGVLQIASSAQNDVDEQQKINGELRIELGCRSQIASDFAIKHGEMDALIAEGLVLLARGEPLDAIAAELDQVTGELETLALERADAVIACETD